MFTPMGLSVVFVAIAIIFLGAVFRDFLKTDGKLTITRKIWLRLAFIFAGVGIGLFCAGFSWIARTQRIGTYGQKGLTGGI